MSAVEGRADFGCQELSGPFLAKRRHAAPSADSNLSCRGAPSHDISNRNLRVTRTSSSSWIPSLPLAASHGRFRVTRTLLLFALLCYGCIASANAACPMTGQFIERGDGTVTNTESGLMWKRCVQGVSSMDCATGIAATFRWVEALNEARSESFAGFDDWRLPKIDELKSIVDTCSGGPTINPTMFPNSDGAEVWSASASLDFATASWALNFSDGQAVVGRRDDAKQVRLVRGGP